MVLSFWMEQAVLLTLDIVVDAALFPKLFVYMSLYYLSFKLEMSPATTNCKSLSFNTLTML